MLPKKRLVTENSVVQVNEHGPKEFVGCFVIVTIVGEWGIQGRAAVPVAFGNISIDLLWEQLEYIGQAILRLDEIKRYA
jgi:hypothetical protein